MNPNALNGTLIQQKPQNIPQKKIPLKINLNKMNNLLCLINMPIVIPQHPDHPLINCTTPGRIIINDKWKCNNCKIFYSIDVPSFYCTVCDYDLCQKCILNMRARDISVYNFQDDANLNYSLKDYSKSQFYKHDIHGHPIVKIKREPCFVENKLNCNFCTKILNETEEFYYCSFCNFCLCINCYNHKVNNFVNDIDYFPKYQNKKNL